MRSEAWPQLYEAVLELRTRYLNNWIAHWKARKKKQKEWRKKKTVNNKVQSLSELSTFVTKRAICCIINDT
jgi:hypothetical protein